MELESGGVGKNKKKADRSQLELIHSLFVEVLKIDFTPPLPNSFYRLFVNCI